MTLSLARFRSAGRRFARMNFVRWKIGMQVHVDDRQSFLTKQGNG
jgi:hypothetical protein